MFTLSWMHHLFVHETIHSEEELYKKAKLIITTTFDKPDEPDSFVITNHTQQELRQMLRKKTFDPSANNNELLLLACRLKYKPIALRLLLDTRVNPFTNNQVVDELFLLIKMNKWSDILPHLFDKISLDLEKRAEYCTRYEQLDQRYKFIN